MLCMINSVINIPCALTIYCWWVGVLIKKNVFEYLLSLKKIYIISIYIILMQQYKCITYMLYWLIYITGQSPVVPEHYYNWLSYSFSENQKHAHNIIRSRKKNECEWKTAECLFKMYYCYRNSFENTIRPNSTNFPRE